MNFTQNEIDDLSRDDYTSIIETHMINLGVATLEEISLVTGISGWNVENMNGILYYKTGLNDLGQLLEENGMLDEEED